MWAYESVFYQIYPLGFCGAPKGNDGVTVPRIRKVADWAGHISSLGCNALYFSPIFDSDSHGYDTRDFRRLDCRLGENQDFAGVCKTLHDNGIRVVLDGVFNHVGRGFWAFQDVLHNRERSPYRDWFHINFGGNSNYNDGLWYEGWEGHFELVKLNLQNEDVINHIFSCIEGWVKEFDIDGLRLDVAYSLDKEFIRRLRAFCDNLKPDFFLVGELMHGDYNQFVTDGMLHSATNYECYKGLYSSFNSMNMFEITHSLLRQFGPENWSLYRGKHLLSFVDNHDVSRIASNLANPNHLPLIYAMMFGMPGIPCVYYGSEWGEEGAKMPGTDDNLRPSFDEPINNSLSSYISRLAYAHKHAPALCYGDFKSVVLTNQQVIFCREWQGQRVLVAINASDQPYTANFDAQAGNALDLITGKMHDFGGGSLLPPYSASYWMTPVPENWTAPDKEEIPEPLKPVQMPVAQAKAEELVTEVKKTEEEAKLPPLDLEIRKAQKQDLPAVLALYSQLHDMEETVTEIAEKRWNQILSDPRQIVLLACADGKPVATCTVIIVPNMTYHQQPWAILENIVTDKEYRCRGCGLALLAHVDDIAEDEGCYKIEVLTSRNSPDVLSFYNRAGFHSNEKTAFIKRL